MKMKKIKFPFYLLHSEVESRDASFKPVPVVQKPISSVLEKIRLRKLEVSKKSCILHHSDSIADTDFSMREMSQLSDLSGS